MRRHFIGDFSGGAVTEIATESRDEFDRIRDVSNTAQRNYRALVGIEACASSHHWSRELQAETSTKRQKSCRLNCLPLSGN
jgi:transposase